MPSSRPSAASACTIWHIAWPVTKYTPVGPPVPMAMNRESWACTVPAPAATAANAAMLASLILFISCKSSVRIGMDFVVISDRGQDGTRPAPIGIPGPGGAGRETLVDYSPIDCPSRNPAKPCECDKFAMKSMQFPFRQYRAPYRGRCSATNALPGLHHRRHRPLAVTARIEGGDDAGAVGGAAVLAEFELGVEPLHGQAEADDGVEHRLGVVGDPGVVAIAFEEVSEVLDQFGQRRPLGDRPGGRSASGWAGARWPGRAPPPGSAILGTWASASEGSRLATTASG